MEAQKENKIKTATERLSELEMVVGQHHAMLQIFQESLQALIMQVSKETGETAAATKKVQDNLEALVSLLTESGAVSSSAIKERQQQVKMNDLINKLNELVENGTLVKTEGPVSEASFVVMEEFDKEGNVFSPRTQILLSSLDAETRQALVGAEIGSTVDLGEKRTNVRVLEVYEMNKKAQSEETNQDSSGQE